MGQPSKNLDQNLIGRDLDSETIPIEQYPGDARTLCSKCDSCEFTGQIHRVSTGQIHFRARLRQRPTFGLRLNLKHGFESLQ
jgi:hypothetical protein